MRYIYKTVMLNEFAHSVAGKKYLARGLSFDLNQKAGKMVEALLNHYAKDGWEYWRNETFAPLFFQSLSSALFNISVDTPHIPVFIFRKEYTEELQKELEEDEKRAIEESKSDELKISFEGGVWVYKNQRFSKRSDAVSFAEEQIKKKSQK